MASAFTRLRLGTFAMWIGGPGAAVGVLPDCGVPGTAVIANASTQLVKMHGRNRDDRWRPAASAATQPILLRQVVVPGGALCHCTL